ncbi:MAG TPA: hypothetical protein P5013_06290 [Methanoregula sp.]|nr:hypothetical protein [Methanoregula sp.]
MTFIEILKKQWYVFVVILAIIIILLNLSSIFSLFAGESFSTLRLYELNGSYNPQGIHFSLTDEDFKEFPQLALIIRDKKQNPLRIHDDSTRFYMISLTANEMDKFNGRYWLNSTGEDTRIFEYKGKYYEFTLPEIH